MSPRKRRLAIALGLGLPFALALVPMLLARPEAGSLLAPFFGPWAGLPLGHSDCTMGNQAPAIALGLVVLGAVCLPALALAKQRGPFALTLTLSVVWAVGWELAALLSVINTTS